MVLLVPSISAIPAPKLLKNPVPSAASPEHSPKYSVILYPSKLYPDVICIFFTVMPPNILMEYVSIFIEVLYHRIGGNGDR